MSVPASRRTHRRLRALRLASVAGLRALNGHDTVRPAQRAGAHRPLSAHPGLCNTGALPGAMVG